MLIARRAAGTMTVLGIALIVLAAFIGSAVPVQALVTEVGGNPRCTVGELSVKDDGPTLSGFSNGAITITYTDAATVASVTAADGYVIDAVIVKGGPNANVYTTAPFVNLVAPDNNGGNRPDISHVEVCYSEVDESTTTTEPTTTTRPKKVELDISGACVFDKAGDEVYTIWVEVRGEPGTTGTVKSWADEKAFEIDDTGLFETTLEGVAGDNKVAAYGPDGTRLAIDTIQIADCEQPNTHAVEVGGACEGVEPDATYTVEVSITGDAGATGVVTVNGEDFAYEVGTDGTFNDSHDVPGGANTVKIVASDGTVHADEEIVISGCEPTEVEPLAVVPSLACTVEDGKAVYTATVEITGEPGTVGAVDIDGHTEPFDLGAAGEASLAITTSDGDVLISVRIGDETVYGPEPFTAEDCGDGPKGEPDPKFVTIDADLDGVCEFDDEAHYSVSVTVIGEPGATGVIDIDGTKIDYVIYDDGTATFTEDARAGDIPVTVTDDIDGEVRSATVTIEDCGQVEVLSGGIPSAPQPAGNPGPVEADTPDVAVKGIQVAQDELPFTGPADGPLAAAGSALVGGGLVLLLATRTREEDESDLAPGWKLR